MGRMYVAWQEIKVAAMFLTTVRVNPGPKWEEDWGSLNTRSLQWYPLIGLGIAAGVSAIALATCWLFQAPWIAITLALAGEFVITGGLHWDGLSDTVDAVMSGARKEVALQIMADPHIGAMGVISIVLALASRFALWTHLLTHSVVLFIFAMGVSFALSRLMAVLVLTRYPRAKATGLAAGFDTQRQNPWVGAGVVGVLVVLLCGAGAYWVGGLASVAWILLTIVGAMIAAGGLTIGVSNYLVKKLGGVSGDCCGAAIEFAQQASLYVFVILWSLGGRAGAF